MATRQEKIAAEEAQLAALQQEIGALSDRLRELRQNEAIVQGRIFSLKQEVRKVFWIIVIFWGEVVARERGKHCLVELEILLPHNKYNKHPHTYYTTGSCSYVRTSRATLAYLF